MTSSPLLARALVAFLALPGTVAFLVPLTLLRPRGPTRPFAVDGIPLIAIGCVVLLWCVRDFYVAVTHARRRLGPLCAVGSAMDLLT